ncbi:MBOAT family protein [Nitrogeniibacter mangrovi]|uniref:Probable alginate O-acetylase AlgI n=1 Tax=Nitrogeniibacter mangrovi TaxID=2016596 RepID=A0A6C1B4N6_9RHOO|nr:MBOAT family protein [Nitrogeniibacter mangrovi]QID17164.1 MBOAT family protein [Nitrogeniibacter mangrovi]
MLFTSAAFAFLFLPITVAGFFLLPQKWRPWGASWLFVASLFFYGYWMPSYVVLLLVSIVWNYLAGMRIAAAGGRTPGGRFWLILGVTVDLLLLAYFKYAAFLVNSVAAVSGLDLGPVQITLPIGISFFTFTQIAFLADAYQKGTREYAFSHYGLFVTYFPHLIAGPVLHHAQMMPQFRDASTYRLNTGNLVGGLAIFALGLFKKVVLADGVAPYADGVFNAVHHGATPDLVEAWMGALAYTFQLYFDFSGYSDMAIGLSWMLNIRLPYNFDSPYKALSISDFWRRWHMSLSNFLRDYLYIPLGGNRKGPTRRYVNLFITMLLGGLWHGAAWTFVVWGGLHGLYLAIDHAFSALMARIAPRWTRHVIYRLAAWALTFLSVVVAWVFFRAESFTSAFRILHAMTGHLPAADQPHTILWNDGLAVATGVLWCAVLGALAFLGPNSNRIGERTLALVRERAGLRALLAGAVTTAAILLVLINETRDSLSAFIYFNF